MAATHEVETAPALTPDLSDDDALLTVHDTARFLKVSVTWVYEHVRPHAEDRLFVTAEFVPFWVDRCWRRYR